MGTELEVVDQSRPKNPKRRLGKPRQRQAAACLEPVTLAFLLDRTGSMSVVHRETVTAYNEFLVNMTELAPNAAMSLAQFDSIGKDALYQDEGMANATMLTEASFEPRGGTNLWDAIGWWASRIGIRRDVERKIFVVLTDGQDNCSSDWQLSDVRDLVQTYTKEGWTFVMLSTGAMSKRASEAMGFPDGNIYLFDQRNVVAAVRKLTASVGRFLSGPDSQTSHLFIEDGRPSSGAGAGGAIQL